MSRGLQRAILPMALAGWMAGCLVGCDPGGPSVEQVGRAQPGATVLPLETANPAKLDGGLPSRPDSSAPPDAAPPAPEPFESYEVPAPDRLGAAALPGLKIHAHLHWRDGGPWPAPSEKDQAAIERLRAATAPTWSIELAAAGRMRVEIAGRGQPLPQGTSLATRIDRFGSILVWPNGARYRLLPPGTLRSTLSDRRADVSPLAQSAMQALGAGKRLETPTRIVGVRSSLAHVDLELAKVEGAGLAAPLFCRLVLELAGIDPRSEACSSEELVLYAKMTWLDTDGSSAGGLDIEVRDLREVEGLAVRRMKAPPDQARYVSSGLPGSSRTVFLSDSELMDLRSEAVEPPSPTPGAPDRGLVASNQSDRLLFLMVDGIVVASVPPWQSVALPKLKSGPYTLKWFSFLGDPMPPPVAAELPSRFVFGAAETEKPDAG